MTGPSEIVATRDRIAQLEDVIGLLKVKDAEIARLTAENERLDKTVGTLADEIQRLQSVVDAAVAWSDLEPTLQKSTERLLEAVLRYRNLDGEPCPTCSGGGEVQDMMALPEIIRRNCPDCHGTGVKP